MMMITEEALMQTNLPLAGFRQGKVRDIYESTMTDGRPVLVIIATDRISAFDVVMPNGVPGKGIVLTQISKFWFDMITERLADRLEHHLISTDPTDIASLSPEHVEQIKGRTMIGRRCKVVPIECVVRGYLAGSGWAEYQASQTVCGIDLPAGLRQADKLPEPIFTPSTKAETGHDENISFKRASEITSKTLMTRLRDLSIDIYRMGHDYALNRGIILADTKFEFGLPIDYAENTEPPTILIDEVLTPDSSRFWPADQYHPGSEQPNFDKQYVRNYLQEIVDDGRWDKNPPSPSLSDQVVQNTMLKYIEAYRVLTGKQLKL